MLIWSQSLCRGDKITLKPGPCNFCPGHEESTGPELMAYRDHGEPNSATWRTRVVNNLYPAASTDNEFEPFPCSDM